jgi:hypothetical protein
LGYSTIQLRDNIQSEIMGDYPQTSVNKVKRYNHQGKFTGIVVSSK